MLGFITRLVGGAIAPLVEQVSAGSVRLLRKLALFLVAAVCMVIVLIALTLAFSLWISSLYGPIVASLVVAGIFLLIAAVAVLLALRGAADKKERAPTTDVRDAANSAEPSPGLDAQIDQFAAPLLALLEQFGLRRERFAVMAGASVAKQLGPLPLVGLAIVAGFLIGRMWKSWRTLLHSDVIASLLSSGLFGFGSDRSKDEPREEA